MKSPDSISAEELHDLLKGWVPGHSNFMKSQKGGGHGKEAEEKSPVT